jgi:signal transduction histidine kinase
MKANRGSNRSGEEKSPAVLQRAVDLQQKYIDIVRAHQRLLTAYTDLVDRYRFIIHDRGETSIASEWFMGAANGLALLRDGLIVMTNRGLRDLDRTAGAKGWRESAAGAPARPIGPEQYESLRDLMRALCARAMSANVDLVETRCESVSASVFADVRVQRSVLAATYIGIATDVTARVRAENELEAAHEAQFHTERMRSLGALSSGLAHDINNSLNALKLHLSVLAISPDKLPDKLPTLNRIVDDCASLVRRLQDFARQRRDRPLGHCHVEKVIEEAVQTVHTELIEKTAMSDKPVTIAIDAPPLPIVPGDPFELRHVFVNLLLNARDAMPEGGKIEITGHAEGDRVIVAVADEGQGIPPNVIGRLFDPFFTTKGTRGTGLGLATAYSVLSRLGGGIQAENRPSRGAVFTVTFPAAPDSREIEPRPAASANGVSAPRRILAIDDHPENIEPLKALFETKGHHVDVVFSGADAIDRVSRGDSYDLVLCDIGMPEMNGWQVAERLRGMTPGVAIYLITGWAQEIPPDEPRRALIDGLISKPVNLERLEQIIARAP